MLNDDSGFSATGMNFDSIGRCGGARHGADDDTYSSANLEGKLTDKGGPPQGQDGCC